MRTNEPNRRAFLQAGAAGVAALEASGTRVEVRTSRLPRDTMLMDPHQVPAALALGAEQAAEDATTIGGFWA